MDIKKIGVIGAGQMGTGIAQICALAGIEVALNDVSDARINAGLATIAGNIARQVERKQIEPSARDAALSRIQPAAGFEAFGDCDLIIEAATENEEIKRKIFSKLCASLKPTAMLATNTSSISITRLASGTDRPERFIGIHFMNPVPRMQLVELIRGIVTENTTFDAAKALIARLGKTFTVSEDFPAFIVNRILLPMINEAIYTLYEGADRSNQSTPRCGSARTIQWDPCSSPISSGSTLCCPSCKSCMTAWPIQNIVPVRCL